MKGDGSGELRSSHEYSPQSDELMAPVTAGDVIHFKDNESDIGVRMPLCRAFYSERPGATLPVGQLHAYNANTAQRDADYLLGSSPPYEIGFVRMHAQDDGQTEYPEREFRLVDTPDGWILQGVSEQGRTQEGLTMDAEIIVEKPLPTSRLGNGASVKSITLIDTSENGRIINEAHKAHAEAMIDSGTLYYLQLLESVLQRHPEDLQETLAMTSRYTISPPTR